jgi:hypothetical protein
MWIGTSGAALPRRKACARRVVHNWFAEVPHDMRLVGWHASGRALERRDSTVAASTPVGEQPATDRKSGGNGRHRQLTPVSPLDHFVMESATILKYTAGLPCQRHTTTRSWGGSM